MSLVFLSWCRPVFRSPSFRKSNGSRVFMYACGFFIVEQDCSQSNQKLRKGTILLLLTGCKQALLNARGRAGRVFRTCSVGIGGAIEARCVCVWAADRQSPKNVRRAF